MGPSSTPLPAILMPLADAMLLRAVQIGPELSEQLKNASQDGRDDFAFCDVLYRFRVRKPVV